MNINEILKTDESRKSFLLGLVFLSKCDGVVDEEEKKFFLNAAIALQISENSKREIDLAWNQEVMPKLSFSNKKEKLFFIMQAIQLSNVENFYSTEEKKFIYSVASDLGVSKESVQEIEVWVEEGIRWQVRGEKLLELEV
ncbi:hypothetical protein ABHA01_01995 [Clostridium paraputrificum]|uniref:hypothetical protein n=1 Tax=Clostridium paraputrificum TaxID=29363 RepID=UPI00325AD9CB